MIIKKIILFFEITEEHKHEKAKDDKVPNFKKKKEW